MGGIVSFDHPKWSKINFGKAHFGHIFDAFLVPKRPIFKAFGTLEGPKKAQSGLKMGSFHLFVHPKWSTITLRKMHF